MSWDITKVEDHENKCWIETEDGEHRINPVTKQLIAGTRHIGIQSITEKNHEKVLLRYEMDRIVSGAPLIHRDGETGAWVDRPFTLEDIKAHIGLVTNASSMTDAAYKKQLMAALLEKAEGSLSKQRESAGGA